MKPFAHLSRMAGGCGMKHPEQEPEAVEQRSILVEDVPDSGSTREHTRGNNKKCSSKDCKSFVGPGNAGRTPHKTAKSHPVVTNDFANIIDVGSPASTVHLSDASAISPAAAAGDGAAGISFSPNAPVMEKLHSTLLTLTARRLPSAPLPKMDEVIARFMNISPKQWHLLNTTIDELNARFNQGALHWLLLRWLVAAHPEQFFPPPFNSYQQVLQQVSQKDAELEEAKNDAAKWRDECARLEAERQTWKRQLEQTEKEVSGLYSALAQRQETLSTNEGYVKQQPQQCSELSGCSAAELPAVHKDAVKGRTQQQQPYQLGQSDQSLQRQQQQVQRKEQKSQQCPQDLQVHDDDHEDKQRAGLLLHQLVHPVSSAQDACSRGPPLSVELQQQEGKKVADPSNLACAPTTTRTKTTVTTTKSSSTSSHSVCVTRESDLADDSIEATEQMRDEPAHKDDNSPQAVADVRENGRTADEATLFNILGCVQSLLRRITAENKNSPVRSPSPSSLRAGEGSELSASASPRRRYLSKRHGKKMQKKNVELWYLQYQQQCSPSAAKEEDKGKRKQQLRQENPELAERTNGQEQQIHQTTCDYLALMQEKKEEEEKQLQDEPSGVEEKHGDSSALIYTGPRPGPAAGRGADAQLVSSGTDGHEVEKQSVGVQHCSPCVEAKSHAPRLPAAAAETSHAHHAPARSETPSLPYALLEETQGNSPVNSYIRRFMAVYEGGQNIPKTVAIHLFTGNLKPALKQFVRSREPTSLAHAILLARQAERYSATSAVPVPNERIRTEYSSAHSRCHISSAANLDVAEEEVCGHSKGQQLKDCAPRASGLRVSSQCLPARQDRHKNFLHKNEAANERYNARKPWQVQMNETEPSQQLHSQHLVHLPQQQEQLLQDTELLEEEVWHSSEDTGPRVLADGAVTIPTARRDLQQQRYDEEQQQKVMVPRERIVAVPSSGSKPDGTERTHDVGKVAKKRRPKCIAP